MTWKNVYPALDIVALTSRNEGTPLTLIEAMANARPVISTAVGGVVDLLGDAGSTGSERVIRVCERASAFRLMMPQALRRAWNRLVNDAALRRETGERGLQFVASHYSKERLLKDIENLYDHC